MRAEVGRGTSRPAEAFLTFGALAKKVAKAERSRKILLMLLSSLTG
jgi:hypothetical protein